VSTQSRRASLPLVLSRRSSSTLGPLTVDAARIRHREETSNHVPSVRHFFYRKARECALKLRGRMSSHGERKHQLPTIF
jgi:hypothetical protein